MDYRNYNNNTGNDWKFYLDFICVVGLDSVVYQVLSTFPWIPFYVQDQDWKNPPRVFSTLQNNICFQPCLQEKVRV